MKTRIPEALNSQGVLLLSSISQLLISFCLPCFLSLLLPSQVVASGIAPDLGLTKEEISWLDENRNNISYGPNPNWPPGDYMENGQHKGIVSDYIKIFEDKLGITFQRSYYEDWEHFYDALMTNKFDLVGAVQKTEERQKVLVFTEPFLTTRIAILTKSGSPDLKNLNDLNSMAIAGIKGYSSVEYAKSKYPGMRIVPCEDDLSGLLKLSAGAVDGVIVDYMIASYLIDKYSITNIKYAAELDFHWDLRFGINKNKTQLRSILNKVLATINEQERKDIYHRWVNLKVSQNPGIFEKHLKIIGFVFFLLLISLLVAILLNRYLQNQIEIRAKELKESSGKLNESLTLFQSVFESANVSKSITKPNGQIKINKAYAEMLGYQLEDLLDKNWRDFTFPEDLPLIESYLAPLIDGTENTARFEKRYIHKDGSIVWGDTSVTAYRDQDNNFCHFITTIIDITVSKNAEEKLRHNELLLREMERIAHIGAWEFEPYTGIGSWTDEVARIHDLDPAASTNMEVGLSFYHGNSHSKIEHALDKAIKYGKPYDIELELISAKGIEKWVRSIGSPVIENGKVVCIRGSFQDITDFKRSEKALEEAYDIINRSSSVAFTWKNDTGWPVEFVSENVQRLLGYSVDDFREGKVSYFGCIHDEDVRRVEEEFGRVKDQNDIMEFIHEPYRIITKDGEQKYIRNRTFLVRDDEGRITLFKSIIDDISEQLSLEDQLRQAQKMEAVGRLAGGVAHDYNNILSVIIGYTEIAMEKVKDENSLKRDLRQIYDAANRSKGITRQLLAFARKEAIAPKFLDLNATVENMLGILKKVIGEDIELNWHPGKINGTVLLDPSQLDQVLANLCINSRDAIADVGKITIETNTATIDAQYCAKHPGFLPGEFVLLVVSDNGCGIEREMLENIFEPFFTTKDLGKGTGLGLSTVYGIVKQNNGFINVYSELGHGTTFRIYLPKHSDAINTNQNASDEQMIAGKGETILVVEDDKAIAELVEQILTRHDYKVLLATNPSKALVLGQEYSAEISLLITDVVMPEMNGLELSEQMKKLCPHIECVFMSGYTANVIVHHGVLDEGIWFIQKPFSSKDLLIKVRDAINSNL